MRARALLIGTALISSILGAVVAYLVLTVPNDLEAGALMKQAKKDIDAHQTDRAREKLSQIVQQYPRTDAAAAATVALVKLADADRARLAAELAAIRSDVAAQKQEIATIKSTPPPAPPAPEVKAAPKPAPKPAVKKKAPVKRTHRRRRR